LDGPDDPEHNIKRVVGVELLHLGRLVRTEAGEPVDVDPITVDRINLMTQGFSCSLGARASLMTIAASSKRPTRRKSMLNSW
jgi:hypothetical protein